MIFAGETTCPVCASDLDWILRSVLRKAEDDKTAHIECPSCNAPLTILCRVRHQVMITRDQS